MGYLWETLPQTLLGLENYGKARRSSQRRVSLSGLFVYIKYYTKLNRFELQ